MVEILNKAEEKLFWDYNVPLNIECSIKKVETCPICIGDDNFREWLSRFLISDIPTDVLQDFIQTNFDTIIDETVLEQHRKHIIVKYLTDEEIKLKATEDFTAIMSDPDSSTIDEKKAMDTSIRMLYSKILHMQKEGKTDKEFLLTIHELKSLIEMKLKMKRELPEEGNKVDLKDLVKINYGTENDAKEADKQ